MSETAVLSGAGVPAVQPPDRPVRATPRPAAAGTGRGWVAPLAALVLGALAAGSPLVTLVAGAAAMVLLLAFVAPRTTAALTVVAVLFVRLLEHFVAAPQAGYLDDGLVLLCLVTMPLRRAITRRPLRTLPGQWWFAGFLVCGLLSGLFLHVPPGILLTGAYVISKGLLFGWAVAQIDWAERHLAAAARVGAVLVVLCLAAAAVNLAIPGAWNAALSSDKNATEARSFLPSLIGPFTHPIDLGQFLAYSFIAVATWRGTVGKSGFTLALLTATALGALGTARRTAISSVVATWLWLQAKMRSTTVLVALLACLPVAVVVLAAPLGEVAATTYQDYLGKGNPEARTVLTVGSFSVAADHFPGGAGFGRFGSAVAAENYSPEYVARGYPAIWGLGRTKEDGRFLTDTEWPAIIGETGASGALAFAFGLVGMYRAGRRLWRHARTPLTRWAGLTAAGWLVASVVQSVATVTFTGPPTYGLLFGLGGVVAALDDHLRSPPPHESPDAVPAGRTPATRPGQTSGPRHRQAQSDLSM